MPNLFTHLRRWLHPSDARLTGCDDAAQAERTQFVRQFDDDSDPALPRGTQGQLPNEGEPSTGGCDKLPAIHSRAAAECEGGAWIRSAAFFASALGLYLEMVMIRWQSSCMHTFGVFKNVSMLSCFLGLGIGYALAGQRRAVRLAVVLPLLAVQCLAFAFISRTRLGRLSLNPIAEHYVMWQSDWRWWVEGLGGNLFLAVTFIVTALMFIPLGHLAGRAISRLPRLQGYGLNLAGSLFGIGLFVALSAWWSPPIVWMSVAVLGFIPFWAGAAGAMDPLGKRSACIAAVSIVVIMLSFGLLERAGLQHYYSPYQTITCRLGPDSKYPCVARIMVNQASFQRVLNLSADAQDRHSSLRRIAQYYDLPHQIKPGSERVLVVGAGTGNDVAAALRANSRDITAVEIDPAILFLGERLHPEQPYLDPRVRVVNDDARTFLRRSPDEFDMIVYGLLDSHTMLGTMTNVRLDSFVYTVEAFREAAARLSDDGLLAVTFAVMTPQQGKKLYLMLAQAFGGEEPRCFEMGYDAGVMMLAGPASRQLPASLHGLKEVTGKFADPALLAEVSTDDWPFFYMPRRTYPLTYAIMILVLASLSGLLIFSKLGSMQGRGKLFGPFFFLGAGFMLIETKAITQLGLVLGNTWQVSAVVIASILGLAFLANLWIMRWGPVPRLLSFSLLCISLMAGAWVSRSISSGWPIQWAKILLPLILTLPLFFAGIIFSSELARGRQLSEILASNLFGAMFGGFLEYNSMYFGYASLSWIGLAIYAVAFAALAYPFAGLTRLFDRGGAAPALQTPAAA